MANYKRTTLYLHADEDTNWERGEELGLKGEALSMFKYACGEVKVEVEVNMTTGKASIIAVDNHWLGNLKRERH